VNELFLGWTGVGSVNENNDDMEITETSVSSLFGEEWLELGERVEGSIIDAGVGNGPIKPRLKPINRQQMMMRSIDIEKLVEADHPVRAIWEMLGQVDLSRFEEGIRAVEGHAGQATLAPQLLASLWIYAYSEGVSSARELSRMCEYEPGCQWLTAMEGVNYHALSDFRVEHKEALDELFTQILGVLSAEGLVELKQVTQDGTKVKASAGKDTFRREERLREHLQLAEKQIQAMGDPRSDSISRRVAKAQERALRERKQRLELALEELKKVRESKAEEEKAEARVSTSDPEARVMKNGDGGYVPAYNVQVCTDVKHRIIVDVEAVQAGNDWDQLMPAVERIEERHEEAPGQMITDAGYTNRENIEAAAEKKIDLIGPVPEASTNAQRYEQRGISVDFHVEAFQYDATANHYVCPAGKILSLTTKEHQIGRIKWKYRARPSDCRVCPFRDQCCPKTTSRRITRSEDSETVKAFLTKMQTEEAKQIYRQRPQVAEFVNAWIKEKLGLRQFRLRGLVKVQTECLWASLTYNIKQWIRLCWRARLAVA
jgi:transposase